MRSQNRIPSKSHSKREMDSIRQEYIPRESSSHRKTNVIPSQMRSQNRIPSKYVNNDVKDEEWD